MRKFAIISLFSCCVISAFAAHIGFLMPSGAKQGTSVDIVVGGQAFWGIASAVVSGGGVEVESVQIVRSLPNPDGGQRRYMMKVLKNFHNGSKEVVPKPENTETWRKHDYYDRLDNLSDCERDILYRFLFIPRNSLQASPAIASRLIVRLKIAADAAVGEREFRLVEKSGRVSNPLKFFISADPEFREEFFPFPPAVAKPVEFTVPGILNGQIMPGETDSFKFQMKKGETVSFKLLGRYLNPFIGDGVPGHFQAVFEVLDKDKRSVAYVDDYFFDPDPVLTFSAPADGEYTLLIRDAIYRGREDFVYRVTAAAGGYPLPDAAAPVIPGVPVIQAKEVSGAPEVKFPVLIKGTLSTVAGDDYQVKLEKDESVVLELFARRLGLPPDGVIKVYDAEGKLLAYNDDFDRPKAGLILHNTADPLLNFTAPASGIYRVNVSDNAGFSGEAYRYFLRIDRKRPMFAAYTVPSTKLIYSGSCTTVNVIVHRKDDFQGEIKLKVKSPADIQIVGADSIPAGADHALITLEGKYERTRPLHDLKLEASADGFTTSVIPGDEAMQAFAYTHINPAKTFPVRVIGRNTAARWTDDKAVKTVAPGEKLTLQVKSIQFFMRGDPDITLKAENLPEWLKVVPQPEQTMKIKRVKVNKGKREQQYLPPLTIVLQADAEAAGKVVNQIFTVNWEYTTPLNKEGKTRVIKQKLTLPAVQIKVKGNK